MSRLLYHDFIDYLNAEKGVCDNWRKKGSEVYEESILVTQPEGIAFGAAMTVLEDLSTGF